MALLLLFEKSDSLSYNELKATTKIAEDQFPRHVQSLLDAKLLICNSSVSWIQVGLTYFQGFYVILSQELTSDSIIQLNTKYSNKRTKFRIAGTVQKETPQEVEQTHHAVDEDRKMYLQAAIVRIMKSRKILKHNSLIQEVKMNLLGFTDFFIKYFDFFRF